MRQSYSFKKVACLAALLSLFAVSSCVDKKYALSEENVDLNVTLFQEGVCLPLGSAKFSLGGIMESAGLTEQLDKFLQADGETGAYTFCYGPETLDMSENLSSLSGALDIKKIDLSRAVEFSLEGVDVDGLKYDGNEFGFEKDLSGEISGLDVDIPEITSPFTIDAKLRDFHLDDIEWDLNIGNKEGTPNFASLPENLNIPDMLLTPAYRNLEMPVSELNSYLGEHKIEFSQTISDVKFETVIKNSFPKEVKSVSKLHVAEGAKLRISVSIKDPFIMKGEIKPHLDINLSDILHLTENGERVHDDHIDDDFILSDENDWTAINAYDIEGLVIEDEDWILPDPADPNSVLHLDKHVQITLEGSLHEEGLVTTPGYLDDWMDRHEVKNGKRMLDIMVNMEFIDFKVDDVTMAFRPKEIERTEQFEIMIPQLELPSLVKTLDNVEFETENPISFKLSAKNLKRLGDVDMKIDYLELTFPDRFIVKGADKENKVVFEGANLKDEDFEKDIVIEGYRVGEIEDGVVPEYIGVVEVLTKASIGGEIHTGMIPKTEEDDIHLDGEVGGQMGIKNFTATLAGYEVSSETDPDLFKSEKLQIEIPEALTDVTGLVVHLKDNPSIDIRITMPETSFDITPLGDGLSIYFPTMLAFGEGGSYAEYFDKEKHALVFPAGEEFPSVIEMPIKNIVINPEKNEEDGKWYTGGELKIVGGVGLAEGVTVNKGDIEALADKDSKVEFKAVVPVLEPDVVEMDSYSTSLDMSFEFAPLKDVELPEMLASVGDIVFDDVYMSLSLTTEENFPSIGDDGVLTLGLNMELPEFVDIDDERFKDGKLTLSEEFVRKGSALTLELDPIRISGLNLDMTREELSELADSIKIEGSVVLTGAALNIDDWAGEAHRIDVIADLKTIKDVAQEDEKIDIKSVTGVVDYQIPEVKVPVDLSGLASMTSGGNLSATIDINTFYLALGVKTNLGVPVNAEMVLTPYVGKEAKEPIQKALSLEPASSSEDMKETKYWISNKKPLEGSGYEYMEIDLINLLYADKSKTTFIDSLTVSIVAGTDNTKECRFEPNASYALEVNYMAGVPLEFGEDFKIEYRDTIADLGAEASMLFAYGSIGLGGSAQSTIPLNFNLNVNMLDAAGKVIDMGADFGTQTIKACDISGNPVKTPLNFVLGGKKNENLPDVEAIELVFSADASGAAGVPLSKDTNLELDINALIPEGISVDLRELLNDMLLRDDETTQE